MSERQKAIDEFRHAVQGVWLDLVVQHRQGAELSMALRVAQTKTDQLAAVLYDTALAAGAAARVAVNGAAAPALAAKAPPGTQPAAGVSGRRP